jgi:hypothetical protein
MLEFQIILRLARAPREIIGLLEVRDGSLAIISIGGCK